MLIEISEPEERAVPELPPGAIIGAGLLLIFASLMLSRNLRRKPI